MEMQPIGASNHTQKTWSKEKETFAILVSQNSSICFVSWKIDWNIKTEENFGLVCAMDAVNMRSFMSIILLDTSNAIWSCVNIIQHHGQKIRKQIRKKTKEYISPRTEVDMPQPSCLSLLLSPLESTSIHRVKEGIFKQSIQLLEIAAKSLNYTLIILKKDIKLCCPRQTVREKNIRTVMDGMSQITDYFHLGYQAKQQQQAYYK